jgi:hypothetical protein
MPADESELGELVEPAVAGCPADCESGHHVLRLEGAVASEST